MTLETIMDKPFYRPFRTRKKNLKCQIILLGYFLAISFQISVALEGRLAPHRLNFAWAKIGDQTSYNCDTWGPAL